MKQADMDYLKELKKTQRWNSRTNMLVKTYKTKKRTESVSWDLESGISP
jgi:hypothetical protein